MCAYINESAVVDRGAFIGIGTRIWHFSHIQEGSVIGEKCVIGQGCYVGEGVIIGNGVKLQNNVSVYSGVVLEDNVFCGPSCVFTNDICPRSEFSKSKKYIKTIVKHGATIGANSTIVCGVTIGRYAMIGAGSVVVNSIKDFELVYGCPANHKGWVCKCGYKLNKSLVCSRCGTSYEFQSDNMLKEAY